MTETITLAEWLKALRSGEYKQGRGSLKDKDARNEDVYCCLGVGTALTCRFDEFNFNVKSGSPLYPHKFLSDLPKQMWRLEKTGGQTWNVEVTDDTVQYKGRRVVSSLNDSGLMNFKEIADIVEARARELGWKG